MVTPGDHRSAFAGRTLPAWFDDAKFGIFVHWTAAVVPAFAPIGPSPLELIPERGLAYAMANNSYVEWYQNSLAIEGSPAAEFHAAHHAGETYDDFVRTFLESVEGWDAAAWARTFAAAGARYVVLVTKHHDGVTLWPSSVPNPNKPGWGAERDVVGDLADAVRAEGMRFGVYYSGGIDWTFGGLPIHDPMSWLTATPQSDEYLAYADAHWRELIERYEPSVLWNDIGYPAAADLDALLAEFYDRVPDGVVNDRFRWGAPEEEVHSDFATPEYSTTGPGDGRKWESTRGMGSSFGYNRTESPDDHLSVEELVSMVVEVAAHGGNVLLNVGPTLDGRIPWVQSERLLALGSWLAVNGDAIYGTRPLSTSAADVDTACGRPVRFTTRPDADGPPVVFATVLGAVPTVPGADRHVRFPWPGPELGTGASVRRLGHGGELAWTLDGGVLDVTLAELPAGDPAFSLRIAP